MALISVQNLVWGFGDPHLLDHISFNIEPGDRICLLGRNGVGKSSLLKLLSGEITPDEGEIVRQKGLVIRSLEQEVPCHLKGTVFDVVADGAGEKGRLIAEYLCLEKDQSLGRSKERLEMLQACLDREDGWGARHEIEEVLSKTRLDADACFSDLSAGMKRRVLFARALAGKPDLLILDEPTNHLDISSITLVESFVERLVKTVMFVSHDRTFVRKIAGRIFELDRGGLFIHDGDYDAYLKRRESDLAVEEKRDDLFDKKLKVEEQWIRKGVKARRTRNEGRVRALENLRKEFSSRRQKMGSSEFRIQDAEKSGKLVIEAKDISCSIEGRKVIDGFSATIMRGERVGIIGSNGSGKTTLLKLMLNEISMEKGSLRYGTHIQLAYFDQLRESLDGEKTVAENIVIGNDFIVFNGQKRHVMSYLKDFLFTPERSRTPVHVLSGGEKNRLMLAKLFTCPFNLLVLDEPTNDLDIETLELLEDILFDFEGTLLLVSHDRTFLNQVVTTTLSIEENGKVVQYAGGYDDFLVQKSLELKEMPSPSKKEAPSLKGKAVLPKTEKKKLGYMEKRELESLPELIEAFEAEQQALFSALSDPLLYRKAQSEISSMKSRLEKVESDLKAAYRRWEVLDSMAS